MTMKLLLSLLIAVTTLTNAFHLNSKFNVNNMKLFEPKKLINSIPATLASLLSVAIISANPSPAAADDWTRLADVGVREFLVKDGRQFLRLAQPTVKGSGKEVLLGAKRTGSDEYKIQEDLELVRLRLEQVGVTNPTVWGNLGADEATAETLFKKNQAAFISGSRDPAAATSLIEEKLKPDFTALTSSVKARDGQLTFDLAETAAADYSQLRAQLLPKGDSTLPYKIPEEYASLPRLNGYATVDMKISSKKGFKIPDSYKTIPDITIQLTLDGYHNPLTAGNFVDLVDKKFYDNMPIQKADEQFIQTGKPASGSDGYVDPATKQMRTIPLEIFYKQDAEPVYGITSDDDNRATETMALPFQAYGAIGMARDNAEADSGSSQFFFLKWRQALNPPGRNTLDGFYSCFGYVTSTNEQLLSQVTTDDKIVFAKVTSGLENLKR